MGSLKKIYFWTAVLLSALVWAGYIYLDYIMFSENAEPGFSVYQALVFLLILLLAAIILIVASGFLSNRKFKVFSIIILVVDCLVFVLMPMMFI